MAIFKRICFGVLLVLTSTMAFCAPPERFLEGRNYRVVDGVIRAVPPVSQLLENLDGKQVVVEFFSYGCHWCHALEPHVHTWEKNNLPKLKDVAFRRIPIAFNDVWRLYSKAYYVSETFGVTEKTHAHMFKLIHDDKNAPRTQEEIAKIFSEKGLDAKDFNKAFESFTNERKFKWGQTLAQAYEVRSVPTMIVVGKKQTYMVTSAMAGGDAEVFDVIEFLLNKDRVDKNAKTMPKTVTGNKNKPS